MVVRSVGVREKEEANLLLWSWWRNLSYWEGGSRGKVGAEGGWTVTELDVDQWRDHRLSDVGRVGADADVGRVEAEGRWTVAELDVDQWRGYFFPVETTVAVGRLSSASLICYLWSRVLEEKELRT